jgi:hypothetical protein
VEEGIVDRLNVDAAVLNRHGAGSQLHKLAGGSLRIGERAFGDVRHRELEPQAPMLGLTCPQL